ncbi:MAG: hypothetical protein P8184_16495, partial [Calditrichia bacterium]
LPTVNLVYENLVNWYKNNGASVGYNPTLMPPVPGYPVYRARFTSSGSTPYINTHTTLEPGEYEFTFYLYAEQSNIKLGFNLRGGGVSETQIYPEAGKWVKHTVKGAVYSATTSADSIFYAYAYSPDIAYFNICHPVIRRISSQEKKLFRTVEINSKPADLAVTIRGQEVTD